MFAIPSEAHEISPDDLTEYFPDHETLQAWKEGDDMIDMILMMMIMMILVLLSADKC